MQHDGSSPTDDFGSNAWLVEDMRERYEQDPQSVSEHWREYFAGETPVAEAPVATATETAALRAENGVAHNLESILPLTSERFEKLEPLHPSLQGRAVERTSSAEHDQPFPGTSRRAGATPDHDDQR